MSGQPSPSLPFVPLADGVAITVEYVDYSVRAIFSQFLKGTPSDEITHGIIIGLLTKAKKLYESCAVMIGQKDALGMSILARSYYETTITLRYILRHLEDDKSIQQFIIGDAMEQLKLNDVWRTEGKIDRTEQKRRKTLLELSLAKNGLSIKDIPKGFPKSWHPIKSYKQIARSLDTSGEALGIYEALYSATSLLAHPTLTDIMRWHVTKKDNKSPYIPNEHNMYLGGDSTIMLACISLAMLEDVAGSSDEFRSLAEHVSKLHSQMHIHFNDRRPKIVTYIESLKKYAEFWSQNYPE